MSKTWHNQPPFPVSCRASQPPHIPAQGCGRTGGSRNTRLVCISCLAAEIPSTYSILPPLAHSFSSRDTQFRNVQPLANFGHTSNYRVLKQPVALSVKDQFLNGRCHIPCGIHRPSGEMTLGEPPPVTHTAAPGPPL